MFKSLIKYMKLKKGKIILALFKFQTWAFIFSVIFFVIAGISAYSVYKEGKTAQNNAQGILEEFEKQLLIKEKDETAQRTNTESEQTIQLDLEPSVPIEKKHVEANPIAKIQIKKLGLNISVLSEWSYALLDISVCKFDGPEPNEPGNFVVIGHDYLNGAHFGKLHLLENGDSIELTDLSDRKKTYEVYEILTIKPDEVDKLKTNEASTVTLVTCNPDGKLRLVVKCKEVT